MGASLAVGRWGEGYTGAWTSQRMLDVLARVSGAGRHAEVPIGYGPAVREASQGSRVHAGPSLGVRSTLLVGQRPGAVGLCSWSLGSVVFASKGTQGSG